MGHLGQVGRHPCPTMSHPLAVGPGEVLTSKPEPVVKSADKPKSIHCEPHQRKNAGKLNFASR